MGVAEYCLGGLTDLNRSGAGHIRRSGAGSDLFGIGTLRAGPHEYIGRRYRSFLLPASTQSPIGIGPWPPESAFSRLGQAIRAGWSLASGSTPFAPWSQTQKVDGCNPPSDMDVTSGPVSGPSHFMGSEIASTDRS